LGTLLVEPRNDERLGGLTVTTWSKDELRKIVAVDDLHASPLREDGVTHGTPTWI
jgi:hypothetical protein